MMVVAMMPVTGDHDLGAGVMPAGRASAALKLRVVSAAAVHGSARSDVAHRIVLGVATRRHALLRPGRRPAFHIFGKRG